MKNNYNRMIKITNCCNNFCNILHKNRHSTIDIERLVMDITDGTLV